MKAIERLLRIGLLAVISSAISLMAPAAEGLAPAGVAVRAYVTNFGGNGVPR